MQTPVMPKGAEQPLDLSRIAQDLQIRKLQVESVVQLLDEGNTVPFVTRYRKERTGGLDEELIRQIQTRVHYLRQLAERKQTVLKSIEGQGKLTDELRNAILTADTSKRLEDLYLPYKPKKRTLATVARERGLEPLALAIWSRESTVADLGEVLPRMVNPEKELNTPDDVLLGVQHILAEQIAETAEVRAAVRSILWETGKLCTIKSESLPQGQGLEYKDYFQFTESARHIPPHRILAINRGEKEGPLKSHLEWDVEAVRRVTFAKLPLADHPHAEFLKKVVEDALARLLLPSLEREIRRELTDEAEEHAVRVFARNLRSLLLQPPLRGRRVLAIDPGFRTGCKLAALDEHGSLLEHGVIYPFGKADKGKAKSLEKGTRKDKEEKIESSTAVAAPALSQSPAPACSSPGTSGPVPAPVPKPCLAEASSSPDAPVPLSPLHVVESPNDPLAAFDPAVILVTLADAMLPAAGPPIEPPASPTSPVAESAAVSSSRVQAQAKMEELVRKYQLNVVAIGNGTACRETEELVSEMIAEKLPDLAYVIVNEAGASVYSASAVGREEFPSYDATLRGTISIGRRLQDPLSELVKIDPQNIGVGLYQHDLHPRRLKDSLEAVIESCVNYVGVDLNTASVPLLRHVSGLNQLAARELVEYRKQYGPFKDRAQLLQVSNIGPARYVQAAGFLKIIGGDNPLDQTWIHPESYPIAERLLAEIGTGAGALADRQETAEACERLKGLPLEELATRLEAGALTLRDIVDSLARPGRDPREDLPPPIFKKGILKLEDLQPGMELKGTVLNVVDFGAFIDIGLKDSGLVHISQMANRYIKNPYDMLAVGDAVTIWVLAVDQERRRVSLTMIKPGTQRRPPEKQQQRPQQQGSRPPRKRRPPPDKANMVAVPTQGPPARSAVSENAQSAPLVAEAARPAPRPPQRPRKPYRQPPKPKLSQAALEGAAPLRTFGELKAFFEAQKQPQVAEAPKEEQPVNGSSNPAN